MSDSVKDLRLWSILWGIAVVLTALAQLAVDPFFFIFVGFFWLILGVFGLALMVGCGIILRQERRRALPALIPLVGTVLFLVVWNFGGGARWAYKAQHWGRFVSKRGQYESIITRIEQGKLPRSGEASGISYRYNSTNPKLVSFIEPGGMLDNYTAIVYDPTDTVLKINALKSDFSNFSDPKLQSVKKLFGGDMVWAEPLGNHWYRCGFT